MLICLTIVTDLYYFINFYEEAPVSFKKGPFTHSIAPLIIVLSCGIALSAISCILLPLSTATLLCLGHIIGRTA